MRSPETGMGQVLGFERKGRNETAAGEGDSESTGYGQTDF